MTRIASIKSLFVAALAGLAIAFAMPPAHAGDPVIDSAKAAGAVGERIDGYLAVVDPSKVDAATMRKVEEINAKRRSAYADIAQRSGATVEQAARVTGEQLVASAKPGEFTMDETGRWTKH